MAYSYDHDCPFEAFVTNLGKYNEGELAGEWVKFPTTYEEMQKVFERIGIGRADESGNVYEEWFISDYDCYVDGLYDRLGEYESLDELNYLANKLEEMDYSDYEHFLAAIEISDYTHSVKDLINLTDNLDKYDVMSGIKDYDDLGREFADDLMGLNFPEHLKYYFDYERYGRDIALEESGAFTDYGYIRDNNDKFIEYYEGNRDEIPWEYRVTATAEEQEFIEGQEAEERESAMLDEATDLAFDMDTMLRNADPAYAESHPDAHGRKEELADLLLNGNYRELKELFAPIAAGKNSFSQEAGSLMKRLDTFDGDFIGKDERMLTASMELAADADQFFRGYHAEYAAMFPDETVQQIALHEQLYKGRTSAIKTGLINTARERGLEEAAAPLIARLTDFEKEYGIDTYCVYQIQDGEEYRDFRFEPLERLEAAGHSPDAGNYELVYSAPLTPGETLESIYRDLNLERPDNFHGHSLSVSDVVVFQDHGKESAYYCDSFGFREIPGFLEPGRETEPEKPDGSLAEPEPTLAVLVVEPMKEPYVKELPPGLGALQKEVGGIIAAAYPFHDLVAVICNDESKLNGMEPNRALRDENGKVYDIVCGPFLVAGLGEEDFTSLSPELAQKYMEHFRTPEMFVQMGDEIMVLPAPMKEVRAHDDGLSELKDAPEAVAKLTFYVAECMEFPSLGEYHNNLSLAEAVELYHAIPSERLNGVKGIGFLLEDGSIYDGEMDLLSGNTIDTDTINEIPHYRESPLVQQAIQLIAAVPEAELHDHYGVYHDTYRYYITEASLERGAYPLDGEQPPQVEEYGHTTMVENGLIHAVGYLEYTKPLSPEQVREYSLAASPMNKDYLRSAEMSLEDDYGMIDGIINNGQREATPPETGGKPSLREKLAEAKRECAERKAPEKNPGRDTPERDSL
ncbi:antirestriction protein ArdA [Clostridium transplantifaecale]|uniref:antirestriction protein ArdA n=1 Tax=Clostridium transplantifaecale TaxID=2479838 RepID=UPI0013DDBDF9|nr:antirestriction protein ArdA [Clostridium transplantifaecale]